MGKHNGKARSRGLAVGAALSNKSRQGRQNDFGGNKHTTDMAAGQQSILDQNNLDEIMTMADMAGRDFVAERNKVIVLDKSLAVGSTTSKFSKQERLDAENRSAGKLSIPRRPHWTREMTPEQLDDRERSMFLEWRRSIAKLEKEEPALVLTPFEKNLEVWRQLWRVLERSDIIVQVVDCRDPLLYRSDDLESYAREIHPAKSSMLLLNKSDLLPEEVRLAWADYFDKNGIDYAFWSAKLEDEKDEEEEGDGEGGEEKGEGGLDPRARLLSVTEVLKWLEEKATAAATQAVDDDDPKKSVEGRRAMAGLVGYPNVGKSSTINVLFGRKKTAVAPTPGKTKHFQTLNVSDTFGLCDCPGLVFPRFASSKAEMVAAGVIPIDRLVDVIAPMQVVADRMGYSGFEKAYGVKLPHTKGRKTPLSAEVLAAVGLSRGWTKAGGLADETRTARYLLKEYVNGKLLFARWPPGMEGRAPMTVVYGAEVEGVPVYEEVSTSQIEGEAQQDEDVELGPGDLDLLKDMPIAGSGGGPMPRRASHKFQRKPSRKKGNRGRNYNDDGQPATVGAFVCGRRGNLTHGVLGPSGQGVQEGG